MSRNIIETGRATSIFLKLKRRLEENVQLHNSLHTTFTVSTAALILSITAFIGYYFPRTFLSPTVNGDEVKYHGDLLRAIHGGLANAIDSGASITFLSVNYFLNEFLAQPLLSVRLTSFICAILIVAVFVVYGKKLLHTRRVFFQALLSLIYCLSIQLTLFVGYNDLMMHFFGILFWILFLGVKRKNIYTLIAMGLLLALVFATRKMGLIYILTFLFIYFLQIVLKPTQRNQHLKRLSVILGSSVICLLLINFTSLKSGHGLSFDDKKLNGPVNWAQWEYHNALLIDQGKQERFNHVEIARTKEFLVKNGDNSLPTTFIEMIIFDVRFTSKEFFVDIAVASKYFIRQTGLWPFLFLFFLIARLKKVQKTWLTPADFIYFFSLSCFLLFCFIVITNIQMRWFIFFIPIMFLLIARDFEDTDPVFQRIFFTINNLLLVLMFIPFWIK